MNINKILIGFGVLIGSILIVENLVMGGQAQIIIWYSNTGTLTIFSILVGMALGFGIKGIFMSKSSEKYNDEDGLNF